MPDPLTRLHLIVKGEVQGVGFRWFARERAEELGVSGWTRNREDGTVDVEAEGTAEALAQFVRSLEAGPPASRVEQVARRTIPAQGGKDFEIRH